MREILPVANELDPVQGELPMELRQKMGDMGYFGTMLSEESGSECRLSQQPGSNSTGLAQRLVSHQ